MICTIYTTCGVRFSKDAALISVAIQKRGYSTLSPVLHRLSNKTTRVRSVEGKGGISKIFPPDNPSIDAVLTSVATQEAGTLHSYPRILNRSSNKTTLVRSVEGRRGGINEIFPRDNRRGLSAEM